MPRRQPRHPSMGFSSWSAFMRSITYSWKRDFGRAQLGGRHHGAEISGGSSRRMVTGRPSMARKRPWKSLRWKGKLFRRPGVARRPRRESSAACSHRFLEEHVPCGRPMPRPRAMAALAMAGYRRWCDLHAPGLIGPAHDRLIKAKGSTLLRANAPLSTRCTSESVVSIMPA